MFSQGLPRGGVSIPHFPEPSLKLASFPFASFFFRAPCRSSTPWNTNRCGKHWTGLLGEVKAPAPKRNHFFGVTERPQFPAPSLPGSDDEEPGTLGVSHDAGECATSR